MDFLVWGIGVYTFYYGWTSLWIAGQVSKCFHSHSYRCSKEEGCFLFMIKYEKSVKSYRSRYPKSSHLKAVCTFAINNTRFVVIDLCFLFHFWDFTLYCDLDPYFALQGGVFCFLSWTVLYISFMSFARLSSSLLFHWNFGWYF